MPFYKCLLIGENFVLLGPGEDIRFVGFATTRFVKAANPDEAELKSVDLVRADKEWESEVIRENLGQARIYLDEIIEIDAIPKSGPGQGYTFFRQKKLKE